MTVRTLVVLILVCVATLPAAHGNGESPDKGGRASEVTVWNTFASNLVAANLPPGPQTYTLAVAQIAIHDALNAH